MTQHPFSANLARYNARLMVARAIVSGSGIFLVGMFAGAVMVHTFTTLPVDYSECPTELAPFSSPIPPARPE